MLWATQPNLAHFCIQYITIYYMIYIYIYIYICSRGATQPDLVHLYIHYIIYGNRNELTKKQENMEKRLSESEPQPSHSAWLRLAVNF